MQRRGSTPSSSSSSVSGMSSSIQNHSSFRSKSRLLESQTSFSSQFVQSAYRRFAENSRLSVASRRCATLSLLQAVSHITSNILCAQLSHELTPGRSWNAPSYIPNNTPSISWNRIGFIQESYLERCVPASSPSAFSSSTLKKSDLVAIER